MSLAILVICKSRLTVELGEAWKDGSGLGFGLSLRTWSDDLGQVLMTPNSSSKYVKVKQ